MKRAMYVLVLFGCMWAPGSASGAVILYSDIGPGFPADADAGFGVPNSAFWGQQFTVTQSGALTNIVTGAYVDHPAGSVTIALYTDSANEPGTLLESWTQAFSNTNITTTIFTSLLHPEVSAGSEYWLVASGAVATLGWTGNDTGATGGQAIGDTLTGLTFLPDNPPSNESLGFRLNGVTPEPSSGLMAAVAALSAIGLRRKMRRG